MTERALIRISRLYLHTDTLITGTRCAFFIRKFPRWTARCPRTLIIDGSSRSISSDDTRATALDVCQAALITVAARVTVFTRGGVVFVSRPILSYLTSAVGGAFRGARTWTALGCFSCSRCSREYSNVVFKKKKSTQKKVVRKKYVIRKKNRQKKN